MDFQGYKQFGAISYPLSRDGIKRLDPIATVKYLKTLPHSHTYGYYILQLVCPKCHVFAESIAGLQYKPWQYFTAPESFLWLDSLHRRRGHPKPGWSRRWRSSRPTAPGSGLSTARSLGDPATTAPLKNQGVLRALNIYNQNVTPSSRHVAKKCYVNRLSLYVLTDSLFSQFGPP